jgi:ABC-type multidrug transport system fused ATPase/permease subunit
MKNIKKILFLLTSNERRRISILFVLILLVALLEMLGVASILPFMSVLMNPNLVETNEFLNFMFTSSKIFGVNSTSEFLFALGIMVFLLLVFSLSFKIVATYVQVQFIQMFNYSISRRLIEEYLYQPYSWFLNRNSAEIGKTILTEVSEVVGNGIKPMIELLSKGLITLLIVILLIIVDPITSLIVCFSIGTIYGIIFYFIRIVLVRFGSERLKNNRLRFIAVSEAFGASKEVKIGGLEKNFIKRFSASSKIYAKTQAYVQVLSQLPRFFLEIIIFGGLLLIVLYSMDRSEGVISILPIISLYAFAGYRLMPAIQTMYSSLAQLTYVGAALDKLYHDIKNLKTVDKGQDQNMISLNKGINLKNIYYNYPNSSRTTLKNISLTIPAKSTVGLVGTTGSGKTTIVDIILGLLEAQKGNLEVDGKIITTNNVRSWQRSIGYVPQNIYLSDDTVTANIAFGINPKKIKQDLVEKASKIANLHDFIINELPHKYETITGERGIRLSGGQRQRIGIARALYHNPKVLVLDEATSALDNQTEKAVMDAVYNLTKDVTIVLIAHRLSTVKQCDKIFLFEKGELKNEGTFDELINSNKDFKKSANNL